MSCQRVVTHSWYGSTAWPPHLSCRAAAGGGGGTSSLLLLWGASCCSCWRWSQPTACCWFALQWEQKQFDRHVRLLPHVETFAPQNDSVTCAAPVCLLAGEQAANMKTGGVSTTGCMKLWVASTCTLFITRPRPQQQHDSTFLTAALALATLLAAV